MTVASYYCPRCRAQLRQGHDVDFGSWSCDSCGGRMARVEVLRRWVDPRVIDEAWHGAQSVDRFGYDCILCDRPTKSVTVVGTAGAVELEVCLQCQSMWLDAGELAALNPPPAPPAPRELPLEARVANAKLDLARIDRELKTEVWEPEEPEHGWKWIAAMLGLPVEIRERALQRPPWITWSLALAMIVFTAIVLLGKPEWFKSLAWVPAETRARGGVTLITGFLLHAGLWHLLGNVYFLLVTGDDVEDLLGPWRFVALVVAAELGSVIAHMLTASELSQPVVGASGAISGILTYYCVRFPQTKIGTLIPPWRGLVPRYGQAIQMYSVPAWFLLVFWMTYQLMLFAVQRGGLFDSGGVAVGAHLGGAAVGFVVGLLGRRGSHLT